MNTPSQFYHRPRFASSAPATRGQFSVGTPLKRSKFMQALLDVACMLGVVAFVASVSIAIIFSGFALFFCSF